MLLLVTIFLVVVGTISLVIGYVQSSLVPIYVSIGCSVIAGAVLLIFSRMTSRSRPTPAADEGPAPFSAGGSSGTKSVPAMAGGGFLGRSSSGDASASAADVPSRYAADDHVEDDHDDHDAVEGDGATAEFPIDRYDSRRVGEILPLLAELDVDELDLVREREERGKGRATLLARIDQLIEQLEEEDRHEADHRFDAPAAGHDDDDENDDGDEPAAPPTVSQPVSVGALPDDDDYFPIEEYDDLRASEILPLLPELDDDELEMVRQRERSGSARSSIMHRIEALLEPEPAAVGPGPVPAPDDIAYMQDDEDEDDFEPEAEPVVSETIVEPPARQARATRPSGGRTARAPAVKAPAVKAPAAKAPRAVKAPAVKAPAVKAPAVKAPAVKSPTRAAKAAAVTPRPPAARATRAPAKAAPVAAVSKAPTRRAAPAGKAVPVAKAAKAPAAKAAVAKAAPAKRTAQKRTASPSTTPASKATRKAAKR